MDPLTVTEEETRPSLEKRLEAIISGAALLADSSCTRDFHRERIIAECNAIRQALQDLLSEYMNNVGNWFSPTPSIGYMLRFFRCTKSDKLQMSTWFYVDWPFGCILRRLLSECSKETGVSRDGIQPEGYLYMIVLLETVSKY